MGYLAARLLDLSTEMKAARIIQLAWKRFLAIRDEEKMKVEHLAASRIQHCVRSFLHNRRIHRFENAAVIIQAAVRGHMTRLDARGKEKRMRNTEIFCIERNLSHKCNKMRKAC